MIITYQDPQNTPPSNREPDDNSDLPVGNTGDYSRLAISVVDAAGNLPYGIVLKYFEVPNSEQYDAMWVVREGQEVAVFRVAMADGQPAGVIQLDYHGDTVGVVFLPDEVQRDDTGAYTLLIRYPGFYQSTPLGVIESVMRSGPDVTVSWNIEAALVSGLEISVASNPLLLFSPQSITIPADKTAGFATVENYLTGGYIAVRDLESIASEAEYRQFGARNLADEAGPATSVSFSDVRSDYRQGHQVALLAKVNGLSTTEMQWAVTGCTILRESPRGILIELVDQEPTITASGAGLQEILTLNVSVPAPNTPDVENELIRNVGDGESVEIIFDAPVSSIPEIFTYNIYMSDTPGGLFQGTPINTADTRVIVNGLVTGRQYYFLIRAVNSKGIESIRPSQDALTIIVSYETLGPTGIVISELPTVFIEARSGDEVTLNLAEYIKIPEAYTWTGGGGVNRVNITTVGGKASVREGMVNSVSRNFIINLDPVSDVGDQPTLVVFRVSIENNFPITLATLVEVAENTTVSHNKISYTTEHVSTRNRRPTFEIPNVDRRRAFSSWSRSSDILPLPAALTHTGDSYTFDLSQYPQDGRPIAGVFDIEDGLRALVVINTLPHYADVETLPTLPTGTTLVELGNNTWHTLGTFNTLISRMSEWDASNTVRAFTDENELFDIGLGKVQRQLTYRSPLHFDRVWYDQIDYPSDAQLRFEDADGFVEYRNGLVTSNSPPTHPTVEAVSAVVNPEDVRVSWRLRHPTTGQLLPLPMNVRFRKYVVAPNNNAWRTLRGVDNLTITDLEPRTQFELQVGNSSLIYFETPRRLASFRVQGRVASETEYRYRYFLAEVDEMVDWEDAFGGAHLDTDLIVDVTRSEAIAQHTIAVNFPEATQHITSLTEWVGPIDTAQFERNIEVGMIINANDITDAVFSSSNYTTAQTHSLGSNIFPAGQTKTTIVGYLPTTIPGILEDYVEVWYTTPTNQRLDSEFTIDAPTELNIYVRITPYRNTSPVFLGARTITVTT